MHDSFHLPIRAYKTHPQVGLNEYGQYYERQYGLFWPILKTNSTVVKIYNAHLFMDKKWYLLICVTYNYIYTANYWNRQVLSRSLSWTFFIWGSRQKQTREAKKILPRMKVSTTAIFCLFFLIKLVSVRDPQTDFRQFKFNTIVHIQLYHKTCIWYHLSFKFNFTVSSVT